MYQENTVSLVIPCHNEEKGILELLRNRPAFIDEVVVVDNDSSDGTAAAAKGQGAKVVYEPRRGYGFAYQAGLPFASGDILVTLDGDTTYPLYEIERLLQFMKNGKYDFVSACRFPLSDKRNMPCVNEASNRFIAWWARIWLGVGFRDLMSGMWVFKRQILPKIMPKSTGMGFSHEIKIKVWLDPEIKCGELHIDYLKRVGDSKFRRVRDGVSTFFDTLRLLRS